MKRAINKGLNLMNKPSKTLVDFAAKHADKITFYDTDDQGEGYWLYLRFGFTCGANECHYIHEFTVKDVLQAYKTIKPCDCDVCTQALNRVSRPIEKKPVIAPSVDLTCLLSDKDKAFNESHESSAVRYSYGYVVSFNGFNECVLPDGNVIRRIENPNGAKYELIAKWFENPTQYFDSLDIQGASYSDREINGDELGSWLSEVDLKEIDNLINTDYLDMFDGVAIGENWQEVD